MNLILEYTSDELAACFRSWRVRRAKKRLDRAHHRYFQANVAVQREKSRVLEAKSAFDTEVRDHENS